ncbi:MAG: T9SS type A sorting domain-containing protein [Candidatus Krumholzibacteriota bacterium]|nr:T9SS type A sorting domain-containing protein [Candidatus Krumholzibacteriota bacterium]
MTGDRSLERLPFELAYLALLTRYGLKPLSRWEAALSPAQLDALDELGLETAAIERRTLLGRRLPRVLLAARRGRIDAYLRRFAGRRIEHSPRVTRLEGWFFGYPSCCVERFVARPYVENGFPEADRRILFHWACPGCPSTASLLDDYRRIHRETGQLVGQAASPAVSRRGLRAAAPWAAGIAAAAIVAPALASFPDPHAALPAPDDLDGDGLSWYEETILGRGTDIYDGDGSMFADGVDEAHRLHALVTALPTTPRPDGPYLVDYAMDGVEQCAVCGEWVGMGFWRIVDPRRELECDVHKIALHYLEHGAIGYEGSMHEGRVDVRALRRILFADDPAHEVEAIILDTDEDGLEDVEEPVLGTDRLRDDSDDDGVGDGAQWAGDLVELIAALPRAPRDNGPYILEHFARGHETCERCGESVNMGFVEIVNPLEEITVELPFIALHYLSHGRYVYAGSEHEFGRVPPTVLRAALEGNGTSHRVAVAGDRDGDLLLDGEETALGLNPDVADSDYDGTPDGPELAALICDAVDALPDGPLADRRYVVHHPTFGAYQCLQCGEAVNMGAMEIVDPIAGRSTNLSYYNLHFLRRGGFSTDRDDLYGRADPVELIDVLGLDVTGWEPAPPAIALAHAPNPFVSSTEITVKLPEAGRLALVVYDAAGRRVRVLFDGRGNRGTNDFTWDGRDDAGRNAASGVYFLRMEATGVAVNRKMLKLK